MADFDFAEYDSRIRLIVPAPTFSPSANILAITPHYATYVSFHFLAGARYRYSRLSKQNDRRVAQSPHFAPDTNAA